MLRAESLTVSRDQLADLQRLLSGGRLNSYSEAAHGQLFDELDVYVYNMALAAAFLGPLHLLEVTARNSIHRQMSSTFGRDDWWETAPILDSQIERLDRAEKELNTKRGKSGLGAASADDVVAGLDFGFWCGLLGKGIPGDSRYDYERQLWQPTLINAFPQWRAQRNDLYVALRSARNLRNRIGHHEPVHGRDSRADYKNIVRLLMAVSKPISTWVDDRSRIPAVVNGRPGQSQVIVHF